MIRQTLFLLLAFIFCLEVSAQSLNAGVKSDLEQALVEFKNCAASGGDCSKFIGESVNKVYQINDFYNSSQKRYMSTNEIASFSKTSKSWKNLGPGYDQQTLQNAQDQANAKKAVVAVYMNDQGIGHVVVILPGTLQNSGSWGLKVPNVASFFATQPEKSFIDKSLAYAFSKVMMKDIVIYVRN